MSHVPDYFRRWRERYRLIVEDVAERFRIPVEYILKIEAGKKIPAWAADRINRYLGYRAARAAHKSHGKEI